MFSSIGEQNFYSNRKFLMWFCVKYQKWTKYLYGYKTIGILYSYKNFICSLNHRHLSDCHIWIRIYDISVLSVMPKSGRLWRANLPIFVRALNEWVRGLNDFQSSWFELENYEWNALRNGETTKGFGNSDDDWLMKFYYLCIAFSLWMKS